MKLTFLAITSIVITATVLPAASAGAADATEAFARLKSLAGEWKAQTDMGLVHVNYRLIGGGTALEERFTAENMPEMLTVYHLDGDRLLLTHYCMAGNQPRMQATAFDSRTGDIQFDFLDATNLKSPAAGHMHSAHFRIADPQHLSEAWQFFEDGKPKRGEAFEFTRVR